MTESGVLYTIIKRDINPTWSLFIFMDDDSSWENSAQPVTFSDSFLKSHFDTQKHLNTLDIHWSSSDATLIANHFISNTSNERALHLISKSKCIRDTEENEQKFLNDTFQFNALHKIPISLKPIYDESPRSQSSASIGPQRVVYSSPSRSSTFSCSSDFEDVLYQPPISTNATSSRSLHWTYSEGKKKNILPRMQRLPCVLAAPPPLISALDLEDFEVIETAEDDDIVIEQFARRFAEVASSGSLSVRGGTDDPLERDMELTISTRAPSKVPDAPSTLAASEWLGSSAWGEESVRSKFTAASTKRPQNTQRRFLSNKQEVVDDDEPPPSASVWSAPRALARWLMSSARQNRNRKSMDFLSPAHLN